MTTALNVVAALDELLEVHSFDDYGPNGLQVPADGEIGLVATGVSANLELFEKARDAGAGLVLCHHGIFWNSQSRALTPSAKRRLEVLFAADIALAAYHLPLDAHPEVGNNALICAALGLERSEPFGEAKGRAIGWVGRSRDGIEVDALVARCHGTFGQDPLVQGDGPQVVRSVGVLSGAGAFAITEAAARGLDAVLTGEPSEHAMADAREAGIHFLACGHYATETLGVQRLGEIVAERFGVEHRFLPVPNPV